MPTNARRQGQCIHKGSGASSRPGSSKAFQGRNSYCTAHSWRAATSTVALSTTFMLVIVAGIAQAASSGWSKVITTSFGTAGASSNGPVEPAKQASRFVP